MNVITGQAVYDYRTEHQLSRSKMAALVGLTPTKIYNIENGRAISDDERQRLSRVLLPDGDTSTARPDTAVEPADRETPDVSAAEPVPEPAPKPVVVAPVPPLAAEPAALEVTNPLPSPRALQLLDGRRRFSNSEVQTFKRCRRKWWLTYYRNLVPLRESPTGPRATGNRIHQALALYYVPDGQQRVDPRHALELIVTQHWTDVVNSYANDPDGVPASVAEKFVRDANLERAMVEGYVQWLAESGEDSDIKVIGSEQYVEVDGPHDTKLVGRLDVRVQRRHDGVAMFMDHKNVADFTRPVRTIHLDEQMLHYHMLEWLDSEDNEQRCTGALYNMLRRVKRTGQAKPPFYTRLYVPHNEHEIRSFQLRLAGTITDIIDVEDELSRATPGTEAMIVYPTPSMDCDWQCPFVAVCGMFDDGSRVEAMLEAYFKVGDPYDYYTR